MWRTILPETLGQIVGEEKLSERYHIPTYEHVVLNLMVIGRDEDDHFDEVAKHGCCSTHLS